MITIRALQKTAMIGMATLMVGTGGAMAGSGEFQPDAEYLTTWQSTFDGLRDMSPKWGKQGVEAFKASLDAGVPMLFLDVRAAEEWQDGVIDGALLIDLNELPTKEMLARLPEDRNTIIAIYCKLGHRSSLALALLHQLGYENALRMSGGMEAWREAGYRVVTPPQ